MIRKPSEIGKKAPDLEALKRFSDAADDSKAPGPATPAAVQAIESTPKPAARAAESRPKPSKSGMPWEEAREDIKKKILIDLPEEQALKLAWMIKNKIPGSQRRFITEAAIAAIDAKIKEILKG
jgi:hypothetical protein